MNFSRMYADIKALDFDAQLSMRRKTGGTSQFDVYGVVVEGAEKFPQS